MYGTQVPTSIAAGVSGAVTPFALGYHVNHLLWAVLMVVTVVALAATALRLLPRRGA